MSSCGAVSRHLDSPLGFECAILAGATVLDAEKEPSIDPPADLNHISQGSSTRLIASHRCRLERMKTNKNLTVNVTAAEARTLAPRCSENGARSKVRRGKLETAAKKKLRHSLGIFDR